MRTVNEIQIEIEALPRPEYMKLVHWFTEKNWGAWDKEIEEDSKLGKLDFLVQEARDAKNNGELKDL